MSSELIDLLRQALQLHVMVAGERIGQIELAGGEDQQHEDDDHDELRQRIDKARPDIDARTARTARDMVAMAQRTPITACRVSSGAISLLRV